MEALENSSRSKERKTSHGQGIERRSDPSALGPFCKTQTNESSSSVFDETLHSRNFPEKPFIIELCAGSARVTSCARAIGLTDSFGVDHVKGRNCGTHHVGGFDHKGGQVTCYAMVELAFVHGRFRSAPLWNQQ